jgi:hypothetical protein
MKQKNHRRRKKPVPMKVVKAITENLDSAALVGTLLKIWQNATDGPCAYCGKVDELRPYGKNGACICYDCGQKNIDETNANMGAYLFGNE